MRGAESSPEAGYRERRRSEQNPVGQIGPTIGNSLIQTVANSGTIWRGAVDRTFPIRCHHCPSHAAQVRPLDQTPAFLPLLEPRASPARPPQAKRPRDSLG